MSIITTKTTVAGIFIFLSAGSVNAIDIVFDYSLDTGSFFATTARKDVLEAAASFFETNISDSLSAITPGGFNTWELEIEHPGTGAIYTETDRSTAADTLLVFAGGRALGGSTLGMGGPGGWSASGTSGWIDTIDLRGQTDFAPWGGAITFDTGTSWYVDSDTSSDEVFSGFDLFSIALHELGHIFGFGTAETWDDAIVAGEFAGTAAVASFGGNVPLDDDLSHWADGTTSTTAGIGSFEPAMDPSIAEGQRNRFTDLDIAGLQDIGWEIPTATSVPVPPAALFFASALGGLFGLVSRRR